MNKLLLAGVSLIAVATQAASAYAQQGNGERFPRWYIGLGGGLSYLNDSDVTGNPRGEMDFDKGGLATASLGYMPAFGIAALEGLRFEIQGGYSATDIDTVELNGVTTNGQGRLKAWTYMVNAIYDFRNSTRWTPYIGAGGGLAEVSINRMNGFGFTSDSDSVFAYQMMAGLSYSPKTLPNTDWSIGYRYLGTESPKFTTDAPGISQIDYEAHHVEAGARFRF